MQEQETGSGAVIVSCPPPRGNGLAREIRARGNCPLQIGDGFVVELTASDIRESWATARGLPMGRVKDMTRTLALRLEAALSENPGAQVPELLVGDAAAFLLLSLRHNKASLKQALCGCRVVWNGSAASEAVEYLN